MNVCVIARWVDSREGVGVRGCGVKPEYNDVIVLYVFSHRLQLYECRMLSKHSAESVVVKSSELVAADNV